MVRILSARHATAEREWFRRLLSESYGITDVPTREIGVTSIVPLDPWVRAGERVVVLLSDPVLYTIDCVGRSLDHALHALPAMEGWADYHEYVHAFRRNAQDREQEVADLTEFLGVPLIAPVDWDAVDVSPDVYGLREDYLTTGIIPGVIEDELYATPLMRVPRALRPPIEAKDMPHVWIASIPHTGTMFTAQMLQHQIGAATSRRHLPDPGDAVQKWVARGYDVVVPIRDPLACHITSRDRGEDEFIPEREQAWRDLPDWEGLPHLHFWQVDCSVFDRAHQFKRLCEIAGRPVPRLMDWTRMNTTSSRAHPELSEAYRRRHPHPELVEVATRYRSDARLMGFLRRLGCRYPWMDN